jgi:hypothetical protein
MRRLTILAVVILGCDGPAPPYANPTAAVQLPASRWSGATGSVTGQVLWSGARPPALTIETYRPVRGGQAERITRRAPNTPQIDESGAVAGALVYLQGASASAREWDHAPVTLELDDERPMVHQGAGPARTIGLVRRGDAITIVSKQDRFHAVRARGKAFWTFTLPDADRPLTKRLDESGIVELSSAAGYYWMHAYLFVSEHPYGAITDASGRFELPQVPPGDYELVTWMPSWDVIRRERDPESTAVVRIAFSPHHEWRRPVTVRAGAASDEVVTVPK